MKRYIIPIAALAASATFLLTACANEDAPAPEAKLTRITASTGGSDDMESRTSIDPTNFTNGDVGLLWEVGDRIGVYSASTRNAAFTNEKTTADKTTTFAGMISGEPQAAYYPYNPANDGVAWNALKGNVPNEQTWMQSTQHLEGDYKFGVPEQTASPVQMKFRHMVSLAKFTIESYGSPLVGEKLQSITIYKHYPTDKSGQEIAGPMSPLAGDFTFDLSAAAPNKLTIPTSYANVNTDLETGITIKTPDLEVLHQSSVLVGYFTCLPSIKEGDRLHCKMVTDVSTVNFDIVMTETFRPNMVYNFKFMLSTLMDDSRHWSYETKGHEIIIQPAIGGVISVTDKDGNTITNHRKVLEGTELTITVTPNSGKKVDNIMLNGTPVTYTYTYTYTVTGSGPTTISATFSDL